MPNNNTFDAIIAEKAARHAVAPELVKAVIAVESSFNPRAYRWEARVQDASYGLMQILLSTARWMGFDGNVEELYIPETNIEYGTRYLKHQLLRYSGNTAAAVAAYNSGTAYQTSDGKFANQGYVDRVLAAYRGYVARREGEKENIVMLRTDIPQIGPVPASPPVRVQAAAGTEGYAASFETFITEKNLPWVFALGAATLLAIISSRR